MLREFVLEELRLPGLSWSGDREWAVRQTCPVLCAGLVRCSLPPRPSIREVLAVDRLPSAPRGESWTNVVSNDSSVGACTFAVRTQAIPLHWGPLQLRQKRPAGLARRGG